MTLSLVLTLLMLAIVAVLCRGEDSTLQLGSVIAGVVLAFLLMGTVVGAPLQEFMNTAFTAIEGLVTDLWGDLTA
ncbi:hypothetical protein [Prauserella alba]|uniref:Uncharacterized protein n=1 Tax=Prauserella alba TaxID=176898 RepID=A0ABP4G3T4_9PSEU|nr:hypothetical protein [Prauserella alba]MCP2180020.1 hypothetical protein [Prauserella alba]